ncbi:MAG: Fic family protein [Candidatus Magasanikbacteria bacterium]|nr:Fic family protein [Candidatus Magasanikbacteria bacterium]
MIPSMRRKINDLRRATSAAAGQLDKIERKKLQLPGSFFLGIHKILLAHNIKEAGKYRTALHELKIEGKTFNPSEPWLIQAEILNLIEFINNKRRWAPMYKKAFLKYVVNKPTKKIDRELTIKLFIAWYIHHKFVIIHPFTDGNGKMARLLMCLVLRFEHLSELTYPVMINSIINKNKDKYLDALNAADGGNYVAGVNYLFQILNKAYKATARNLRQ